MLRCPHIYVRDRWIILKINLGDLSPTALSRAKASEGITIYELRIFRARFRASNFVLDVTKGILPVPEGILRRTAGQMLNTPKRFAPAALLRMTNQFVTRNS
jgi:hypothetical protein